MSSTHHALYYHLIFGTKDRGPAIRDEWRLRLHEYIGGCVKGLDGIPSEIGGVADHVHLLISLKPTHLLSEVMRDVKRETSSWIHRAIGDYRFTWQDGYGAFTVSVSNVRRVREYIRRQEEHHRTRSFREEYIAFLKRHMVEYKDEYV